MTENNPFGPEKPPEDKKYRYRYPMNEKEEEKTEEKDEKGHQDRGWDEKFQRDPVNTWTWAVIFIWAGLVLLAATTGWGSDTFPKWWNSWALIFTGVGAIIILSALFRLVVPLYRHHVTGGFVPGLIFLGIGLAWLNNWQFAIIWPVILIIIGLSLIFGGIFRRRR
jgi:hypothetical protein